MTFLGGAAAVLVLTGCAAPGYKPSALESELVRVGATPAQAQCITNGLSAKFDLNELGAHSAPSEKELAKTRAILARCEVKLPLQPR
jgi:hypothetical protein